jgi:hypothetical protein
MSSATTPPTPYDPINAVLRQLLDGSRAILGERLVGLYLTGSLAFGDFDAPSSDIDFVAALSEPLDAAAVAALAGMHDEMGRRSGHHQGEGARRLEGFYVPLAMLRRYDPATSSEQVYFAADSKFRLRPLGWDWVIDCHVLREHGVVVDGPPPATLIEPISREQLVAAVRGTLLHDWSQYAEGADWMRPRGEQAFVVLTMCRALCVLDRGEFVSKPEAASWALCHLAPEWAPLIRRALAWREDATLDDAALSDTLRFLRFALTHS